ncbi:hypothetical protein SDC9_28462 [bioreactor metagenome]|uniref:Glycosyltransferase 2-like domain-containing protein n=1 Tax=bioreactor metagenome TaxID=1076179 RepID=A0A644UU63_9ZZZZ|nr:glycosyltransferase [Desulfovibrio desulfuricans]MEA4991735.1 glycosyltransferase [Desulfovibrio desulfuricans]
MPNTLPYSSKSQVPKVSVIMAVYNCAPYLKESIDSIIDQTLSDFEFIIVDDASTDETPQILAEYAAKDPRIRVLCNEQNLKLPASLNIAIGLARASLIARMDGDDWAHPRRLELQYAYLNAHPQIDICGTAIECFGEKSGKVCWPEDHEVLAVYLLFFNAMAHPTVMGRKEAFMHGYDATYHKAQDYELWSRLAFEHGCRFGNLQEVLLKYRVDAKPGFEPFHCKVSLKNILRLGLKPSEKQVAMHEKLCLGGLDAVRVEYSAQEIIDWCFLIYQANLLCMSVNSTRLFRFFVPWLVTTLPSLSFSGYSVFNFRRIFYCLRESFMLALGYFHGI